MAWTYRTEKLSTNGVDQVRFLIGDTDSTDPLLQDEEIGFATSQISNIYGAAIICCFALAMKFSRLADQAAGQSKLWYSQRAKAFKSMIAEFQGQLAATGGGAGIVIAGGITFSQQDPNLIPPIFKIGMDDNFIPVGPSGVEGLADFPPSE